MYEQPNQQQLPCYIGYLASHKDFSISERPIPHPLAKTYSISLTLSEGHKWLYLDFLYFDIANSTDCAANPASGLVIGNEHNLDHVCLFNTSMPGRIIPLNSAAMTIEKFQKFQKKIGDHRRGFLLYYQSMCHHVTLVFAGKHWCKWGCCRTGSKLNYLFTLKK